MSVNGDERGRKRAYPGSQAGPKGAIALSHGDKYNVHMKEIRFEWDRRKEKASIKRHGVSFEEARTAFYDENAIQFYDPDHSEEEDRFILLGLSLKPQVLVVCNCFREHETVVRIISARQADRDEELEYWKQRK